MADSTTPCQGALWFASKGYSVLPLHSVTEAGGAVRAAIPIVRAWASTLLHPWHRMG